jgi:hypothetical protein
MDELLALLGVAESSHQFRQFRDRHLPHGVRTVANDVRIIHYVSSDDGIEVQLTLNGRVKAIFLYTRPRGRNRSYNGPLLPGWLSQGTKSDVRLVCGPPEKAGMASEKSALGRTFTWDRFRTRHGSLHVEYDDTEHTALITIMDDFPDRPKRENLKHDDGRVSRYADATPQPGTVLVFVPSLFSVLTAMEKRKGTPLTREEALRIRDNAAVVTVPEEARRVAENNRGYRDLDPDRCWDEWVERRKALVQPN